MFKGLSLKQIKHSFLEGESPTLKLYLTERNIGFENDVIIVKILFQNSQN